MSTGYFKGGGYSGRGVELTAPTPLAIFCKLIHFFLPTAAIMAYSVVVIYTVCGWPAFASTTVVTLLVSQRFYFNCGNSLPSVLYGS